MFDYQAPADLLKDKVVLVSGAGSGIGKAAALAYRSNVVPLSSLWAATSKGWSKSMMRLNKPGTLRRP